MLSILVGSMEQRKPQNILEDILRPLREQPNCLSLYNQQINEIKQVAKHFHAIQSSYAEAFKRLTSAQQRLKELDQSWRINNDSVNLLPLEDS
jgi:DNA-binding transcriptional regulator/RsmH inhibitor MraZ